MSQEQQKRAVAEAALEFIEADTVIGVGTGSTVNHFIDALAASQYPIEGAVASSQATEQRLRQHHIPVVDLNSVCELPVYIDGADEATRQRLLTKGGGGALTREKIVAAASTEFICLIDASKLVPTLGEFPIPLEVIPMAQSYVGRQIIRLGGQPELRAGFTTDNGNIIIDIHNLKVLDANDIEHKLNNIAGVVCNGLFADRPADVLLLADNTGVNRL